MNLHGDPSLWKMEKLAFFLFERLQSWGCGNLLEFTRDVGNNSGLEPP